MADLTRRDALRKLAVGGAAAATAPFWVEALVSAAEQHAAHYQKSAAAATVWKPKVLSGAQNKTVTTIAELIIPQTETAGATKAKVNQFIDSLLADAKTEDRQKFLDGLAWIDTRSQADNAAAFVDAPADKQIALLTAISTKTSSAADEPGTDFFKAMKALTVTGYYTSEIASREELGDDGQMFFTEFKGCTHPEHQK
jgi:hypothetical protein